VESLAEVLRAGRNRTGLSQAEIGRAIGESGSAVGNYERGQRVPSLLRLGLLARVLPLERSEAELHKLRREALAERRGVEETPDDDLSPMRGEVAWLKNVVVVLSDQMAQLAEAVDRLESGRAS